MESRLESGAQSATTEPYHDAITTSEVGSCMSDDDGEYGELATFQQRRPRTIVERVLGVLGMSPTRRRRAAAEGDFGDARSGELSKKRYSSSPLERRRGRQTTVVGWVKRVVLMLPLVALSIFGILHLIQAFVGNAELFWDLNTDDSFLQDFGIPGHFGAGVAKYPTDATRDVQPIPCHSHNDYWRRVPLFEAIHWGCTGVEADVWNFDNELFVGHNTASLTKNRTFQNLYINPLVDLLDKMNTANELSDASSIPRGVFDEAPDQTLVLLVDFKTNGRETFPVVLEQLQALREKDYLTYHDGTTLHSRPVTVVGTGNTPFDMITGMPSRRDIFFDAPLDEMWEAPETSIASFPNTGNTTYNPSNSYYASVSFYRSIGFVWRGRLSSKQTNLLRGQIRGAHSRGLKVRYWDTPSWPVNLRNQIWGLLREEGADVLNVDDLKAAATEDWRRRVHGFWR